MYKKRVKLTPNEYIYIYTVIGTSLAAGIFPTSVAARSYYLKGNVLLQAVPPLLLGAVGGAALGSHVALHLTEEQLCWCFSGGMFILGIRMLLS